MKINKKCFKCNSEISSSRFYVTGDNKYHFCSEECFENSVYFFPESTFRLVKVCPGYDYCSELENTRKKCIFIKELTEDRHSPLYSKKLNEYPNWCSPAEVSIIMSNMRLFNFVKKSEKEASILNKETIELTRRNNHLAIAMLIVTIANLILMIF